jgi:hypothetical protein
MMLGVKPKNERGGAFSFRVSDVVETPLRGTMLRLRVVDGSPSMKDLGVGSALLLRSDVAGERRVRIVAHATTGGRPSQRRLERARELDVIVVDDENPEAAASRAPVEIGWLAVGPVSGNDES